MKKTLLYLSLFAIWFALLVCVARADIHSLVDITGTGATVVVGPINVQAAWIQCIAPSTNAATVRFGDSTTTSTKGLPIAPGGGYNTPTGQFVRYTLGNTYVYVANGDKVSCAYGN